MIKALLLLDVDEDEDEEDVLKYTFVLHSGQTEECDFKLLLIQLSQKLELQQTILTQFFNNFRHRAHTKSGSDGLWFSMSAAKRFLKTTDLCCFHVSLDSSSQIDMKKYKLFIRRQIWEIT
jgi:hypothetical protein